MLWRGLWTHGIKLTSMGGILCSSSPVSADWAACHMAGFDWKKIPQLFHAKALSKCFGAYPESPESLTVSWAVSDG
jgi:hypothetical protein